jgi:hypothetical protein
MKEELLGPAVNDVFVAVVEEEGDLGEPIYTVYLINNRSEELDGVLVSSRGYAVNAATDEKVETTMLRHYLEKVPPKSYKKIEPIMEDVFGLNNEYWVSFWINRVMHDKKFIFLSETIKTENFKKVPIIEKEGVVIG